MVQFDVILTETGSSLADHEIKINLSIYCE